MAQEKKVFCKFCKHYISKAGVSGVSLHDCISPENRIDTWFAPADLKENPFELNENNDCKLFEEK